MNKVRVITGHYGSGKTECAVSLAVDLASRGKQVALADLDIVNPYFRSRERAEFLEEHGVQVISSSLGHRTTLDLPAISAEIRRPLEDPTWEVLLDLGGDQVGARAMAGFRTDIVKRSHEMLLVVNAYRPETLDSQGVMKHLEAIEYTTKLKVTGLISNTHLIWDTEVQDVMKGVDLCREVSRISGVPIRYIAVRESLRDQLPPSLEGEILTIGMYMRDAWM